MRARVRVSVRVRARVCVLAYQLGEKRERKEGVGDHRTYLPTLLLLGPTLQLVDRTSQIRALLAPSIELASLCILDGPCVRQRDTPFRGQTATRTQALLFLRCTVPGTQACARLSTWYARCGAGAGSQRRELPEA